MAKFNAGEIDALLDYVLSDALGTDGEVLGKDGRVPQPSFAEARKFRDEIIAARASATGLTPEQTEQPAAEGETRSPFEKAYAALTNEERDRMSDAIVETTVEICKGHPSREEITRMPGLTRLAFTGWLMEELSPLF